MANFLPVVQVTKANVYDVVVKSGFQTYDASIAAFLLINFLPPLRHNH